MGNFSDRVKRAELRRAERKRDKQQARAERMAKKRIGGGLRAGVAAKKVAILDSEIERRKGTGHPPDCVCKECCDRRLGKGN